MDTKNIKVVVPGHSYELRNYEKIYENIGQVGLSGVPDELTKQMDEYGYQTVDFVHKEVKDGSESGEMELIKNGTTNEAVLSMLLDRMNWLDKKFPSEYNKKVIDLLIQAYEALLERTKDRINRGVEGKHIA